MSKEEILFLRTVLLDRRSSILERVQKLAAAWQELESAPSNWKKRRKKPASQSLMISSMRTV